MCPNESGRLVVGISSRALFDLNKENLVYESQGWRLFVPFSGNTSGKCSFREEPFRSSTPCSI